MESPLRIVLKNLQFLPDEFQEFLTGGNNPTLLALFSILKNHCIF